MGIEIKMPALSPTMEEGTLAKWLVKEGDEVKSGDILAEIETDKATMEFEAVDEGKIGQIVIAEGTEGVKVGTVIATMAGEGGEAAPAPAPKAEAPKAEDAPKKAESGTSKLASEARATVQDPDLPEGTEFVKTTVREALRDAMAEAPAGAIIRFAPALDSQVITLTEGQLTAGKNLIVDASALAGGLAGQPGPRRAATGEASVHTRAADRDA